MLMQNKRPQTSKLDDRQSPCLVGNVICLDYVVQLQYYHSILDKLHDVPFKDATKRYPKLKELQQKKYPFPDSNLSGMLYDLLEKGVIQFSERKGPKELGRAADPLYCRYHRMVSQPLENYVALNPFWLSHYSDQLILEERHCLFGGILGELNISLESALSFFDSAKPKEIPWQLATITSMSCALVTRS